MGFVQTHDMTSELYYSFIYCPYFLTFCAVRGRDSSLHGTSDLYYSFVNLLSLLFSHCVQWEVNMAHIIWCQNCMVPLLLYWPSCSLILCGETEVNVATGKWTWQTGNDPWPAISRCDGGRPCAADGQAAVCAAGSGHHGLHLWRSVPCLVKQQRPLRSSLIFFMNPISNSVCKQMIKNTTKQNKKQNTHTHTRKKRKEKVCGDTVNILGH